MKNSLFLALFLCIFTGCSNDTVPTEDKTFVTINGEQIEIVSDEQGNQYLKEHGDGHWIYIPFTFETSDSSDTLKSYYANRRLGKRNAKRNDLSARRESASQ